jgi:ubiquinone/menaquinone biosynthesis C-methylase UbiE
MQFPDRSFDFLVCRAAFRNFADPLGALREMDRVLKLGGPGLIIDLRRDALMVDIAEYVDSLEVTFLSRLFMKLIFRYMLLPRAWRTDALAEMLGQIPFHHTQIIPNAVGMKISFDAC